MIIGLHGGGFKNKGAELMLASVVLAFSERYPEIRFCISPSAHDDHLSCKRYGLLEYVKLPRPKGGRLFSVRFLTNRLLSKLVPDSFCNRNGLARYSDIDALIDISGVRFSDKVETIAGDNFLELARYLRSRGKPVILLPQMLGPFRSEDSRRLLVDLFSAATLVFARDEMSYGYVREIVSSAAPIFRAPDITIRTRAKMVDSKKKSKYGCVVPNVRMLDKGDSRWARTYVQRLAFVATAMWSHNIKPIILIHSVDSSEDEPLARSIADLVGDDICDIHHAVDPLDAKAFISQSELLVGSRYHSIVSALSSGVPAIVMGWAHKYETILVEFGLAGFIHKATHTQGDLSKILDQLLDETRNRELRSILENRKKPMLRDSDHMWEMVFETLGMRSTRE
jgi:polysaccharide pyruvyl transferase WcaK-like protein